MVHSLPYVVLEKEIGETPLEAIQRWKERNPQYQDVPASYAGRLDPMATGKLLVLLGSECKRQHVYTKLDKEYEIEVLLDIESDTGDVLGIVSGVQKQTVPSVCKVNGAVLKEIGTHERAYPRFSSKTVQGKPLFLHTLEGTIDTIQIPTHPETIYRIKNVEISCLSTHDLEMRVQHMLACAPVSTEPSKALGADFRINDVRTSWTPIFSVSRTYTVLRMTVVCGTGSYMRTLGDRIAQSLGTRGIVLSIHRTRIGRYRWGFFWKQFV